MTDAQRKSVALEYLKAFDITGVTSSGASTLDLFAEYAQVFPPKWCFEFRLTLRPLKKINHLRMQITAKYGKIYANPQPAATRLSTLILVQVGLMQVHRT